MSAVSKDRADYADQLREFYPGDWCRGFVLCCTSREAHTHPRRNRDGNWIDEPCPESNLGKRPIEGAWAEQASDRWTSRSADGLDALVDRVTTHLARGNNIGLSPPDNVVVIDADSPETVTVLDALLPDAPMQMRGTGSAHFWVRVPEIGPLNNKVKPALKLGGVALKLDLKLKGGQVIVAPSVHRSGETYHWVRELPPSPLDIPTCPVDLYEQLCAAMTTTVAGKSASTPDPINRSEDGHVRRGSRHHFLVQRAWALAIKCDSLEDLTAQVIAAARTDLEIGPGDNWDEIEQRCVDVSESAWHKREGESTPWIYTDEQGRERVNTAVLARWIRRDGNIKLGPGDRLYSYDDGVYRCKGDARCGERCRELLGARFKKAHLSEVLAWMRTFDVEIGLPVDPAWINVKNGLLNWRTGELRDHTPEFLSINQVPVNWVPDARCPMIEDFIVEALPPDAPPLFMEIAGLALYGRNPMQKAVLFLGPGGNGKSVALRLIEALCGPENFSSLSLQTIAENRFAAAELFGKLANICGDLDARSIERTDTFKQLTGGDTLAAEHKFGKFFMFTSHALPIFSANTPPITSDQTAAWFDRWITLPFPVKFRGTDREVPGLADKLVAKGEIEGFLVHAVNGLRDLMARGHFGIPESVAAEGARYREELDSVASFIANCCELDQEAWTPRTPLYRKYELFCRDDEGRHPLSAPRFYSRLLAERWGGSSGGAVAAAKRRGVRILTGIRLVDTSDGGIS